MEQIKIQWEKALKQALYTYGNTKGITAEAIDTVQLLIQSPPSPEMGDFAVPLFPFARIFRTAPPAIAVDIAALLQKGADTPAGEINPAGPYLNIKADLVGKAIILQQIMEESGNRYGWNSSLEGQKIMVEFSCPNTNKPLHLGHLRNDIIGESTSAILAANGAEVQKVNLVNDRGIHICKSMLAYKKFSNGETPESCGEKSDHFVGRYYVKYNDWVKEEPQAETEAQEMLRLWEQNDAETVTLWKLMNRWAVDGIFETYGKTGISFDAVYYESKTYKLGRDLVLRGLGDGVFYREKDNSIWIDLEEIKLDKKVLLRSDGTSLYLTQDLGTAASRHKDWPFERLIYVVGSEQQYHFRVLFHVLKKLGFAWAENLYHLSYGMVNLPDGKMKSREGNVIDADDLIATLTELSRSEIVEKGREDAVDNLDATAASVALAALNYYLLQVTPAKDMIFNPAESIAFNGNTGPYLQYMGARISSMLRKYKDLIEARDLDGDTPFNPELLSSAEEHQLLKQLMQFPDAVREAGSELNPGIIANFLYELAKSYSRFYHECQILKAESGELVKARTVLSEMVLQVLKNGFSLIGVPFLEKM